MVVLLADVLAVPLRDRNELLITAGYAPLYHETGLDAPAMTQLHHAFDFILRQQEPYPTLLLDRHWNVLKVNEGAHVSSTISSIRQRLRGWGQPMQCA